MQSALRMTNKTIRRKPCFSTGCSAGRNDPTLSINHNTSGSGQEEKQPFLSSIKKNTLGSLRGDNLQEHTNRCRLEVGDFIRTSLSMQRFQLVFAFTAIISPCYSDLLMCTSRPCDPDSVLIVLGH